VPEGPGRAQADFGRVLLALIVGQIGLHATMAGVRMAAPLQALRLGHSAWSVGVLMALYAAAPVLLSMYAGRMADRLGYHRPVNIAIGLSLFGALLALAVHLRRCGGQLPAAVPVGDVRRQRRQPGADRHPAPCRAGGEHQRRTCAHVQLAGHRAFAGQRGRAGGGGPDDRRRRLRRRLCADAVAAAAHWRLRALGAARVRDAGRPRRRWPPVRGRCCPRPA
jgi:hypothetical protein